MNASSSLCDGDGEREGTAVPDFVPERFARPIALAAQRWNVSAALLSAQLYVESNFNPFARSPAGAQGLAQFMPGTAVAYGLANPFDPEASIAAQAHRMHDLLRQFAAVPLTLAAYNAGPAPVARCGCVPPFPETRGYVARILGLMGGAGEGTLGGGVKVRLVKRGGTCPVPGRAKLGTPPWSGPYTLPCAPEGFFSFVIDVFTRRVVGWQLARHMRTDVVLRMALPRRQGGADVKLVHHSDSEHAVAGSLTRSGLGERALRGVRGRSSSGPARALTGQGGLGCSWFVGRVVRRRGPTVMVVRQHKGSMGGS